MRRVPGTIKYPKLMSTATLELKPALPRVQKVSVLGFSGSEIPIIGTARPNEMSAVIAVLPKAAMSTGTPPRLEGMDDESTGLSGLEILTAVTLRCASAS